MTFKFKLNPYGTNEILEFNDKTFFISFAHLAWLPSLFKSDSTDQTETALVVSSEGSNKYFILKGDFRNEYLSLGENATLKDAMGVYQRNIKDKSSWSTQEED